MKDFSPSSSSPSPSDGFATSPLMPPMGRSFKALKSVPDRRPFASLQFGLPRGFFFFFFFFFPTRAAAKDEESFGTRKERRLHGRRTTERTEVTGAPDS